jgi:hypothetical protein
MRIAKSRDYAVLTGDVVGSSRLSAPERRKLHTAMSQASTALLKAFKGAVPAPVEIFRGDGWQMLVTDPVQALRIALFYRATLRAGSPSRRLDTRLAIAVGRVDFVPADRVAEGDGAAYRLSGTALESMARRGRMRFVYPAHPAEKPLALVVHLVDGLVSRWSDRQALAVTGALRGWSQETIAAKSWDEPITQQAVAQHLDRAGWSYVEAALDYFEETLGSGEPPR